MDGVKENVEEHFKDIYKHLYNSIDDKENILNLLEVVNNSINFTDTHDVKKVTPEIVKEAAKHLKDGKSDPVHVFSSDCIRNALILPAHLYWTYSVRMQQGWKILGMFHSEELMIYRIKPTGI